MKIDLNTLIFIFFYTNLLGTGAMAFVFASVRRHLRGTGFWLLGMLSQTLGFLFVFARSVFSSSFFLVIGVLLILFGTALFTQGFIRYTNAKFWNIQNYLLLIPAAFSLWYFTSVSPVPAMIDIIYSAVSGIYAVQGGILFLVDTKSRKSSAARITGWVLLLVFAVSVGRVLSVLSFTVIQGQPTILESMNIINQLVNFGLSVSLIMSIILMVNRRLLNEANMQEAKFVTAFHSSPSAILLTRMTDGKIFEVNEGFSTITGYASEELVGQSTKSIHLWVSEDARSVSLEKVYGGQRVQNMEVQMRRKSGEEFAALLSLEPIMISEERCLLATFSDISELSRIKAELEQRATHDSLTGLPNRDLFNSHFEISKAFADRYKKCFAVLSVDIDHFKEINDTYGHDFGDLTLIQVAERLCSGLRKGDIVSRFGGDEFIILLSEVQSLEASITVAEKILQSFRLPLIVSDTSQQITLSIGIAVYPSDGASLQDLLKNADISMYAAKNNGRNRYELCTKKIYEDQV